MRALILIMFYCCTNLVQLFGNENCFYFHGIKIAFVDFLNNSKGNGALQEEEDIVRSECIKLYFNKIKTEYELDNWATISLIRSYVKYKYPDSNSIRYNLELFYYVKSLDFSCTLLRSENNKSYVVGVRCADKEISMIKIDENPYYLLSSNIKDKLEVIELHFSDTQISFNWGALPKLPVKETMSIERAVFFKDSLYRFRFVNNEFLMGYLSEIPISNLQEYDTLRFYRTSSFYDQNLKQIHTAISNFSDWDKLSFILMLVQSLNYIDDIDQFEQERIMSPELTLYLAGGDCDDKTSLLADLINRFIPSKILLITYPGKNHMNLAVSLPRIPCEECLMINYINQRYIILEPSGQYYPIGSMGNNDVNYLENYFVHFYVQN